MIEKDRNGLKDIYTAYAKQIYRVILGIVRSAQDAEDITSEFFLKIWESAASYKSGSGHKRWLTVIARNMALDHLRKNKGGTVSLDDDEQTLNETADNTSVEESVTAKVTLDKALSMLTEIERQTVELKLAMDLTFREIADMLGEPMGTTAWRYRQAVLKLRKIMEEEQL
jgi:RNA polymerase sigma-70 factor (ECF subfamily)